MTEQEEKRESILKEAEKEVGESIETQKQVKKDKMSEEKRQAKQKPVLEKKESPLPKDARSFHAKYHKLLLLIPLAILVFCLIYMFNFYNQNGDFFAKDISLTGGTSVTIFGEIDLIKLKQELASKLNEIDTREIYDLITKEQKAIIIETKSDSGQTKQILEDYLGYQLTEQNSSFEFTGSALSQNFYNQLMLAILLAFIFMAIVVFIIFRTLVPSSAIILSAFADILMTLVFVNLFGMEISSAGIIAFLMLIGYSVDTDILLTNRLLKTHEEPIGQKLFEAFKTGMTMTLTSLGAVAVALLVVRSFSPILSQIFTILVIGLFFDVFNTWVTNASILRWYVESKEKREIGGVKK